METTEFRMGDISLRALLVDGRPWFVAADVAAALGYSRAADMARLVDDDQRATRQLRTPGGTQACLVVDEPGLYSIIVRSERPDARAFRRWVTDEVLPQIRANGVYGVPNSRLEWAKALLDAEQRAASSAAVVAAIEPAAAAWEHLMSPPNGGWSLKYVPRILRRDPAILRAERERGAPGLQQMVREAMFRVGLYDWDEGRRNFRPARKAIDSGLIVVDDDGTVRVTPQALTLLHRDLGGTGSVDALLVRESMEGGQFAVGG